MNTEGNNSNINNNIFMNINGDIFKFNKKRKVSKLNDLIPINRNNLNKTTSLKKDSQNRMITSENQSNLEENIYMIPFTTKRKNFFLFAYILLVLEIFSEYKFLSLYLENY